MELQDIINRVTGEVEFFHCFLDDGVVFGLALLRAALREVEVQLRVVDLPVLLLGGNVVTVDMERMATRVMPYFS